MKYYKRLKIYKASNVTFDRATMQAYSYNWWRFVARIDGKVVFNNHSYSPSTCKHQYKVRDLLSELGINIDVMVNVRESLRDHDTIEELEERTKTQLEAREKERKARRREAYLRRKYALKAAA